jgi:HemX protein
MDKILLAASSLCFVGAFVYVLVALRQRQERTPLANLLLMGAGFVLQCFVLHLRGQMHGRCPITSFSEVLIFVSWSMVMFYFILGRSFRLSLLGLFTSPLVVLMQVGALIPLLALPDLPHPPEALDYWLEAHASISLFAYGAFALACVAGIMYLVQDRLLKTHDLNALFYHLPPIRYLVKAIARLLGIGLLLLSVGIVSAYLMREKPSGLHLALSYSVWGGYALLLGLYIGRRLGPKPFAVGAAVVFALPLITLLAL